MKEEWYLSTTQTILLEKICRKIELGWPKYGSATLLGLKDIIKKGTYLKIHRNFLNTIREDYIKEFCTTTI